MVGKGGVLIAGSNAFASRMLKPGFVDAVVACGDALSVLGLDPVKELRTVLNKENAKLMNMIGTLAAKLKACSDEGAAHQLLVSLRNKKRKHEAMIAMIDA
mmetsp:Transcript_5035/g.15116  ORF Transcript_5035/g.15116 Transcript_5035/m.15116 type:complete len:101 (-) Transcript_5035:402-704(-)